MSLQDKEKAEDYIKASPFKISEMTARMQPMDTESLTTCLFNSGFA
jgi:hypothetical protein